jgi:hypothetical protein
MAIGAPFTLDASGRGSLWGATVLTTGAAGNVVALIDGRALLVADAGEVDVQITTTASLQIDGATTSPPTSSTILTSCWQSGLAAIKITRFLNYRMARANSVCYTTAAWI